MKTTTKKTAPTTRTAPLVDRTEPPGIIAAACYERGCLSFRVGARPRSCGWSSSRRRRAIVASGPGLPRRRGCSGVTVEGGPFAELSSREVRPWELRCEAADAEDMDSCEMKGWTRRARERGSKPCMEWTGGEFRRGRHGSQGSCNGDPHWGDCQDPRARRRTGAASAPEPRAEDPASSINGPYCTILSAPTAATQGNVRRLNSTRTTSVNQRSLVRAARMPIALLGREKPAAAEAFSWTLAPSPGQPIAIRRQGSCMYGVLALGPSAPQRYARPALAPPSARCRRP